MGKIEVGKMSPAAFEAQERLRILDADPQRRGGGKVRQLGSCDEVGASFRRRFQRLPVKLCGTNEAQEDSIKRFYGERFCITTEAS
jgi:hypothetical protein